MGRSVPEAFCGSVSSSREIFPLFIFSLCKVTKEVTALYLCDRVLQLHPRLPCHQFISEGWPWRPRALRAQLQNSLYLGRGRDIKVGAPLDATHPDRPPCFVTGDSELTTIQGPGERAAKSISHFPRRRARSSSPGWLVIGDQWADVLSDPGLPCVPPASSPKNKVRMYEIASRGSSESHHTSVQMQELRAASQPTNPCHWLRRPL